MSIIIIKSGYQLADIDDVVAIVESFGLRIHIIKGTEGTEHQERIIIGAVGSVDADQLRRAVSRLPSVEYCLPITKPAKLVGREFRAQDTMVSVGNWNIGAGNSELILATGSSISSKSKCLEIFNFASQLNIKIMLTRPWLLNRSPYVFQGWGEKSLNWFRDVKPSYNVKLAVSVYDTQQVELAAEVADAYLVDPYAMNHVYLLTNLGKQELPVILCRNPRSTVDDLLMAAEWIVSEGNSNVILCDTGTISNQNDDFHEFDINIIHRMWLQSHLPKIVNINRAIRNPNLITGEAFSHIFSKLDGMIVEVHENPKESFGEEKYSFDLDSCKAFLKQLAEFHQSTDSSSMLSKLELWWLDENGVPILIGEYEDHDLALKSMAQFESRYHKQPLRLRLLEIKSDGSWADVEYCGFDLH